MRYPRAIVTVGISASGKTTWAREYAKKNKAIISNRDDMRFALTGASGWGDYKFDKKIEEIVTFQQRSLAAFVFGQGKDLIVADTNLNPGYREETVETLRSIGFDIEIKDFPITLEDAWKRDSLRGNGVGRDVIYKQWQQWLKYIGRKTYTPNRDLPKAIIFDIDGTLAHMDRSARGPYEWDKVGLDKVDPVVARMLQNYTHDDEYYVVVVSGRDGSCFLETEAWLQDNRLLYDHLIMRDAGDQRKDTVIKEEIFWRDIAPKYNVEAVVDDRPCVVRMWHDIGIPKVIAVGNQHIEF